LFEKTVHDRPLLPAPCAEVKCSRKQTDNTTITDLKTGSQAESFLGLRRRSRTFLQTLQSFCQTLARFGETLSEGPQNLFKPCQPSQREFYRAIKDFPAGALRAAIDSLAWSDADNPAVLNGQIG
ncbi:MAG: hypothetical protein QGD94_08940, partial [Planctomycetia bacterium]|nr:hypothetical protein [Planctomycetia bacterium]